MPFSIEWLDEKAHIYDIVLRDPFTMADQDAFFAEFFRFMDTGPVPMYGLFDVSRWSQSGATGLGDPRFREMGKYRKKIVVIVMVTKNTITASMGRLGAAVFGYRDWMRFEESREKAIEYLRNRAATELGQAHPIIQEIQLPTMPQESQTSTPHQESQTFIPAQKYQTSKAPQESQKAEVKQYPQRPPSLWNSFFKKPLEKDTGTKEKELEKRWG